VVSFAPRPLYPQGKSPWYPLDKRKTNNKGKPKSKEGKTESVLYETRKTDNYRSSGAFGDL